MSEVLTCPACDRPIEPGDVFCTHCGTDVRAGPSSCTTCGRALESDDKFCPGCGASVGTPAAASGSSGLAASAAAVDGGEAETPWESVLGQLRQVTEGRFDIEHVLGEGGMAAVYRAHERALDRKVAIKVMSPAVLMERGTVSRFKQEAITIAALKHPNIITVHGVEHHDQLHFFVLDYVEGRSLEHAIRECGPLPIAVVRAWLAQVASALEYAHRRGVVHRDIKPANILLDGEGDAIVTDFGIAKVSEKAGFTVTGSTVGTPAYMSPEQCLGKPVTGSSDQYSLGVVAYEMLTGEPPFRGSTLSTMRAHTETDARPVTESRPDCPADLARVVTTMMQKDPAHRWASLTEALAAFRGAPPGLHDPVKQEMAALARGERPSDRTAVGPATPTTPVPRASAPVASRIGPLLRQHRVTLGIGTAAVAIAAVGLMVLKPDPPVPPPDPGPSRIASLEITPVPEPLDPGESARLSAVLRDSSGATVYGEPVAWTSSDETVIMVTDGLIEARTPGSAHVTASSGGRTRSVEVLVRSPQPSPDPSPVVASVRLSPGALSLAVGESGLLTARALDASGRMLPDRAASWSVADASVASVTQDGRVRALAPGITDIVARIDGRRASVSVTVSAEAVASVTVNPATVELDPGGTSTLSATVVGVRGSSLAGRALEWRSSNPAVATVSPDGVVTAQSTGTAAVSASAGSRTGQATVTVRTAAPAIDETEAGRQIGIWIGTFARELDAALRAKNLGAVRTAYGAPLSAADAGEWQRRFALDARWRASLARTYPARRIGSSWVSDFELEITVEAAGRTTSGPQRFLAVFEPRGGQLAVTSLEMRLSEEP